MVKVDRAISMLDLRQLLPKTVFESRVSSEGALTTTLWLRLHHAGAAFSRDVSVMNSTFFFFVSVALGGLFCSLCELVSSGSEQTLSLLLQEIKEKDIVSRAVNTLKRFEGQI